jgi:hypothetical protein
MNKNQSNKTEPVAAVACTDLLAAFAQKALEDLMQGEWEPDWEWQQHMLEHAEEVGLIRRRPVEEDDDVPEEYDFIWETLYSDNAAGEPQPRKPRT